MIKSHGRESIPLLLLDFGRHLVYAEGTKTEPLYVDNLRKVVSKQLNVDERAVRIISVKSSKTKHTVELVNFAFQDVQKRRNKGETIDHVWIFYDKDSFDDFDEAYKMIKQFNNKKSDIKKETPCDIFDTSWHACWSNECFEVWVYHYFEDLTSPMPRKDYIKKINEFLKRNGSKDLYQKNLNNLHTFLESNGGSMEKAIKLMAKKDNGEDTKPNPSSGIYSFAEYVNAYLKKNCSS